MIVKIKNVVCVLAVMLITLSFTLPLDEKSKKINIDKSSVTWKGYKVTGSHEGTIALQSGFLTFNKKKLVGGEFVVDIKTIAVTDISGKGKNGLEKHLKSKDFFDVNSYPTAKLVFDKVEPKNNDSYDATGNLTIKDKTNPVRFVISINGNSAKASMKIDRTRYGIEYKSSSFFDNLKNKAIHDEFDLIAELEFE